MSRLAKTTVFSVIALAGAAFAAHAQSGSVAALPPGGGAPPAAIAPSPAYPGPNPGTGYYGGLVDKQAPVIPSPQYVGPQPGAGYYGTGAGFQKPADWEQNTAAHPYTSSQGPRPN